MKNSALKKIRIKDELELIAEIHTLVYKNTDSFISPEVNRLCMKFVKELKECFCSEI